MLQSSSFTSCVLTEIGRQECSWFGFFIQCTCTQCHQSQIDCSLMTGGGSIQCPYNNGRLSLPFTPICNHWEKVITLNITYAHFNGVAFTTSYFKDKAHKSSSLYFLIVYFFLFYSFFSSCFSFLRKKKWLWWWCSKLVIEMQLLNLETHYTCNNGR